MKNNRPPRVDILGIKVDRLTIPEANNIISSLVSKNSSKSFYVVKPYVEFFKKAENNPALKDIINNADLVLADGISLQWAASYLYANPLTSKPKLLASLFFWLQNESWRNSIIPAKMAGANQTIPLFSLAAQHGWRIGIIGGREPVKRKKAIFKKFPKLKYLAVWNGYYDQSSEAMMIKEIKSSRLDILFVATGFSKQEQFIAKYLDNNLATVLIGEGGTFDYKEFGGDIKRAPHWIQRTGLEWLWRLAIQPTRVIRQLGSLGFVFRVRKQAKKL